MTKVTELVADVVTPLAEARGDELVDVEYVKEKKQYYLRIYVDRRPGGIDIEEIANLSELVSEKLDELDPDPFRSKDQNTTQRNNNPSKGDCL